ncbi:MAG: MarR family transcriptional regulator [Rhodospirillaceae bacterium]|jgi:DNA-binding MarR family transcriptional regulator|nr:MarR family transcriptional regulator [Rhodospirillaceae bacterium]MBT6284292.1 MarR family transcriptional regulator [Rhodospirillaceae bacterium]
MARDKVASGSKPAAQLQGSSKEAGRSDVEPPDRAARAVAQWATEFPDWELAPMEALGRLGETATIIDTRHISPLFAEYGLQRGEFDVLAALRRSGAPYELTPSRLFEITMSSSGGMTARLDRLEKMGHVERRPNPDDRRGVLVRLTPSAVELIETVTPAHLANEARLTSCLTADELSQFSGLLKKLLRHAEETA